MAIWRPGNKIGDIGKGFWKRVRDAVQAESGAPKSLWNGKLNFSTRPGVRGSATPDGEILLNEESVVEPLREMFRTRGEPGTPEQWTQRRNALKTTGHEFGHLASPEEHTRAERREGMKDPSYKPIEEGVTEAWIQSRVDRLADRVLPPDLAGPIKAARNAPHSYPAWEPAARAFADQVGAETGAHGDEVLRRMVIEPRTSKARAAADMLFDASQLPYLVPPQQQEAVRQEIADSIDQGFADLLSLRENINANTRSVSRARGLQIADAATDVVRAVEDWYHKHPERQQHRTTRTTRTTPAPGRPTDRGTGRPPDADQDVAIRAALGARPSASGAARPAPAQTGAPRANQPPAGSPTADRIQPPDGRRPTTTPPTPNRTPNPPSR